MNLVLKDDNSGFIDGDRPDRRRIGQRDQPSSKALSSQHLCRPSNFSQQGLQRGQFIFSKNKNLGVVNPVPHRAPLGRGVFRAQARLQQCKSPPGSRASGVPSLSLFLCVSPPSSDCLSLSLSRSFFLFLSLSLFFFLCLLLPLNFNKAMVFLRSILVSRPRAPKTFKWPRAKRKNTPQSTSFSSGQLALLRLLAHPSQIEVPPGPLQPPPHLPSHLPS